MPEVRYVTAAGAEHRVTGAAGDSVMRTALDHDVPGIVGECGGACSCATCHVYVDERAVPLLPPVGELEDEMLEGTAAERRPTSRLSCQLRLTAELDGLTVEIPAEQL